MDPTEARFPQVPAKAGFYESFYLKACHPEEPVGVWIRYTVHRRPGAAPNGSLWFTYFDRGADGPNATKVTSPEPSAADGDWIRIGEGRLGAGEASGEAGDASWE